MGGRRGARGIPRRRQGAGAVPRPRGEMADAVPRPPQAGLMVTFNCRDRASLALGRDLRLGDLIHRLAAIRGDRPLAEQSVGEGGAGERLTYREAADLVDEWAARIAMRVSAGDRVVVATPNSYRFFLLCIAA